MINKLIYNQTENPIRVNNFTLLPGTEITINDSTVDIYKTPQIFYKFLDGVLSTYALTDDFVIYLTDQHGYVENSYFADTTVFMSVDTGKCCMYLAKTSDPIIDPSLYFYNRKENKSKPQPKRLFGWIENTTRKVFRKS